MGLGGQKIGVQGTPSVEGSGKPFDLRDPERRNTRRRVSQSSRGL